MSDKHTPPNHQESPPNEDPDEEYRSINKRYRFWKHPSEDEPEVVKGELILGRTADESTKGKNKKKETPGKMIWGYEFNLSEAPVRISFLLSAYA